MKYRSLLKSCLFFAFCIVAFNANAASPLEKLPFNIVVGKTKNSEIENRGVCTSRIKVTNDYFRCEVYDMAGGKFRIYSSQNEIVTKVEFGTYGPHQLPQAWKDLGLELNAGGTDVYSRSGKGTSQDQFMRIVKVQGAISVTSKNIDSTVLRGWGDATVSFDFGNMHFEAKFATYDGPSGYEDYGLVSLNVTEGY